MFPGKATTGIAAEPGFDYIRRYSDCQGYEVITDTRHPGHHRKPVQARERPQGHCGCQLAKQSGYPKLPMENGYGGPRRIIRPE